MRWLLIIFLASCGSEELVVHEETPIEDVVVNFQLPPLMCTFTFPGMAPMPFIAPRGTADEMEQNPYVECND